MNPFHSIPGIKSQRFENITCWIETSEGPKYICNPTRSPKARIASGWIESIAGQSFIVKWHSNKRVQPLEGRLYIDGTLYDIHILPDERSFPDSSWATTAISFTQTSPYTRRNFVFAEVEKQEGEGSADPTIDVHGTIKLEIRRAQMESSRLAWDYINSRQGYHGKPFPETSDEVRHCVKLSEERNGNVHNVWTAKGRIIDYEPWYTFIFHYRPISILVAKNLVPSEFIIPKESIPSFDPKELIGVTLKGYKTVASPSSGTAAHISDLELISPYRREKMKESVEDIGVKSEQHIMRHHSQRPPV